MFRSVRARLIVLLLLPVAAAVAAGILMFDLFRQSATAQAGRAFSRNRDAALRPAATPGSALSISQFTLTPHGDIDGLV
jgi:hypothetical protein